MNIYILIALILLAFAGLCLPFFSKKRDKDVPEMRSRALLQYKKARSKRL